MCKGAGGGPPVVPKVLSRQPFSTGGSPIHPQPPSNPVRLHFLDPAQANGCASESFNARSNCMVREFADFPRWVPRTQHQYVQRTAGISTNTPWFVNFGPKRRNEMSCEDRANHLRQVRLDYISSSVF